MYHISKEDLTASNHASSNEKEILKLIERSTKKEIIYDEKGKGLETSENFVSEEEAFFPLQPDHFGFAEIKIIDYNLIRYEHRHMGDHHDHMICTKCGRKNISYIKMLFGNYIFFILN